MVGNDGKFDSISRVQAIAAALNFRHMEKQFFAFVNLII